MNRERTYDSREAHVRPTQAALQLAALEAEKLGEFYKAVKHLTDHAFILKIKGAGEIDFVNAEDLEKLLETYNPNPTEDENASTDSAEAALPEIEL